MSRIINPDSPGKQRNKLTRRIALAVRELLRQPEPTDTSRDMAIYIVLALDTIAAGIDQSVAAWEKRDYWVKADRFRMDWAWAKKLADELRQALVKDDWAAVAVTAVQIAQQPRIAKIEISPRHRMGKPWVGAWERYNAADEND